jgi:hypothetical protein
MSAYRVCFDGKWRGKFDDRDEALEWAKSVGDTGRIVHVARSRILRMPELVAVFPESQRKEAEHLWRVRASGSGALGGGGYGG